MLLLMESVTLQKVLLTRNDLRLIGEPYKVITKCLLHLFYITRSLNEKNNNRFYPAKYTLPIIIYPTIKLGRLFTLIKSEALRYIKVSVVLPQVSEDKRARRKISWTITLKQRKVAAGAKVNRPEISVYPFLRLLSGNNFFPLLF